jgi:hypothetical protein
VKGRFENLDNLSYINIWNNITGINTTVYDASWWNYGFAQPQIILSNSTETSPEYDFVFSYNNTTVVNDFNLFLVMAGGFNLFSNSALSLVQWSLPYTFNYTGINSVENYFDVNDDLLVYPNPSTDRITIKSKLGSLDKTYVIVNSIGEHVMTGKLSENATSLDISKLSSGLYLLQIGDKETHTFKLTKK